MNMLQRVQRWRQEDLGKETEDIVELMFDLEEWFKSYYGGQRSKFQVDPDAESQASA